jgi:pectate lyase
MKLVSFLPGAVALALAVSVAQARPVIPGAAGYGIDTVAGRGGVVYKVTNLNASGSGSLKACIDGTSARVCVFEVSGTIRLTADMMLRNSKITIAGQTAPSPGITIRGGALRVQASDVLIQHLRFRVGDDVNGPDPDNRDSIKIEGSTEKPVKNIVIDHCTFSWALDELASVWGPHDNITFRYNLFSEPLNDSMHPTKDGTGLEPHGFGLLIGSVSSGGRVTVADNVFAHIVQRNPLSRAKELVYVNNVVYNRGVRDLDIQSESSRVTKSVVEGNVFIRGPSYTTESRPIYVRTNGEYRLYGGSKVFVKDNYEPGVGNSVTQTVVLTGGDVIDNLLTSTKPVWNNGLTVRQTADYGVYNHVLRYVGARPIDRDPTDRRVIGTIKNRNGQIINCVSSNGSTRCQKNGGGWPTLAQNTRRLTLPSNPNSVASNGYTNLENWLNSMDQTAQGNTQSSSPAAPASVSVY